MKKRLYSLLFSLLLLFALCPAGAWASSDILVNLNTVRAGDELDLLIGTTDSGTAFTEDETLPDGCSIVTEQEAGRCAHYLRGKPMHAGSYEFRMDIKDTADEDEAIIASMRCQLTVLPALPSFQAHDLSCFVGDEATLRVEATVSDGGQLSYQWYASEEKSNVDGRAIYGAVFSEIGVSTDVPGTAYYYCVITNENNGVTSEVTTPALAARIEEPVISSLRVETLPNKQEYTEGDELDPTGLTLCIEYSNGKSVLDGDGFTLSPMKLTKAGTQNITVEYEGYRCVFTVLVKEEEEKVEAVTVSALPVKREYKVGEWLNTQGLTLQVITNKGKTSEVGTGFTCEPQILETPGIQTITVSYGEKTTSFTVTVSAGEKTVQSIEVQTPPAKRSYRIGESFDTRELVLKVVTDQGEETVRAGFTYSPARFTSEGTQSVVISYGGQNCTLEITVLPSEQSAPSAAPSTSPAAPSAAPRVTPRVTEDKADDGSFPTLLLVLFLVGLGLLGVLITILASGYKTEIHAFLQKFRRDEDDDEDE